jgi:dTDP-4-amino-4,6-dideoxygalactose transaminase
MKYKTEILANIDTAKAALDAGYPDLCYAQIMLARNWLKRQREFEQAEKLNAEILSIFTHPMFTKKEAE